MPQKMLRLFRFTPEEVRQKYLHPPFGETLAGLSEFDAGMHADMGLAIAAQDLCQTRDELIEFAQDAQLVPYLRGFVERRGWLDEDWDRRIDQAEEEFRQQVN